MAVQVKICGLNHPETLAAAIEGGARYIGFVFYPRSPRFVAPAQAAELARLVPTGVRVVGLLVDPDDAVLEAATGAVPLDLLQLHGKETPDRIRAIRDRFALPVMKAFGIGSAEDFARVAPFEDVADRLLFDAKPPASADALPGGNGVSFDWTLLRGRTWTRPWMLSGGLSVANLAQAVALSGAREVDVSSGVEERPGVKSTAKIREFLALAATL